MIDAHLRACKRVSYAIDAIKAHFVYRARFARAESKTATAQSGADK